MDTPLTHSAVLRWPKGATGPHVTLRCGAQEGHFVIGASGTTCPDCQAILGIAQPRGGLAVQPGWRPAVRASG